MLTALCISDFVLIHRLNLEARAGFTGLTGETGAGKSIILDALGCVLGMRPTKRFVRAGAKKAVIVAEFDLAPDHPVWPVIGEIGIEAHEDETLILKRVIPACGATRAFINDEPVSGARLSMIGGFLAEVHGQHAASNLLKPSYHRTLLDQFAGNGGLLGAYRASWIGLRKAREDYAEQVQRHADARADREALEHLVAELDGFGLQPGEAQLLAAERAQRMQAGRIVETVSGALGALERSDAETMLATTSAALERLCLLPGFDAEAEGAFPEAVRLAAQTFERASIETQEASAALHRLGQRVTCDDAALEIIEARLFELKALARKYKAEPEQLPKKLEEARERLALVTAGEADFKQVKQRKKEAVARWHNAAEALRRARKAAAKRMQRSVMAELGPLKLGGAKIRVLVAPVEEGQADGMGADRVEIEVETNPGAGFGSLRLIASGGELARFSLALKCALAESGCAMPALIFDEADHGVGGAVAAAIGQRFARLAVDRQVFAVTHSPQVAAAADTGWRIEKSKTGKSGKAVGHTRAHVLDSASRLEEIARMLSGSKVTPEARAAATRLLEG